MKFCQFQGRRQCTFLKTNFNINLSIYLCKAKEELPASLQPIDGVDSLVDLVVQGLDLLLSGCGHQEVVHLGLQGVVNLFKRCYITKLFCAKNDGLLIN